MKIQDEKSQIREKLAIIAVAQKDTDFRLELARKKYNRLNNFTWCNVSSLRMAEADYDYHKTVLKLIDEHQLQLLDRLDDAK
jgi:hypothetical protein